MRKFVALARSLAVLSAFVLAISVCSFSSRTAAIRSTITVSAFGDDTTELSLDDGKAECALGPPSTLRGRPGFGWANKLTPKSYPSTLQSVTIGFDRNILGRLVTRDSLYRIVVFTDPEMDGPGNDQQPDATFIGRVRGQDELMTFNLALPLTISSGSFVVGAVDEFAIADLPALLDSPGKSTPPGSESFVTFDGGLLWQKLTDVQIPSESCSPGSFLIRAAVENGAATHPEITRIKDPLAVEPWGVGAFGNQVAVANYVSDNVTIINTGDNTFQNAALFDPRACATCGPPLGPFGVSGTSDGKKIYVTLFGSSIVPSKEFPVDYATVLAGRVAVLSKQAGGTYAQSLLIGVGKGPRFPAMAGIKLYVPCGGDNRVDVIDTTKDQKIAEVPVGKNPSSCIASLDGSKIYVTNFGDGSLSVIDTATNRKVKDIPAPQVAIPSPAGSTAQPASVALTQPWRAAHSPASGYLYVTYWGTAGDVFPNGAVAVFDTCNDEFVHATLDAQTRGTAPGSPGSTGIPAPTSPLIKDASGKTPGAGGGGGGPFGIAACQSGLHPLVFTNDGAGIVGLLDSRIDQVVSAPPVPIGPCPKPRGVACAAIALPTGNIGPPLIAHTAYVACGQPENCVLVFRVPEMPENIPNIPIVESVDVGSKLRVNGRGLRSDTTIDLLGSPCLGFKKPARLKKGGTQLFQKGKLTDGTSIDNENNEDSIIRLLNPDGSARLILRATVRAVPAP